MELNLDQQKQIFMALCQNTIHREGLENLLGWLNEEDFFTAPASTKYHGAYAGGLCQHSMDVFQYAKKLAAACDLELNEESLAVASLFHDICKVDFYQIEYRSQKVDGMWQQVPYYSINEQFVYGGHGSKSVFLVERFMMLEAEEAVAINCHMGFSEGGNAVLNVGKAYETCPLAWVVHVADEAAAYLLDR